MCTKRKSGTSGFTLVEMLVVMMIIVLAIGMAVPAIRYLTGSKSQEGAQNVVSGMVAFARNDAVGVQQIRGVLFVLDDDDRVKAYEVQQSSDSQSADVPGVTYLDFVPDRDPVTLPGGLRLWTLNDADATAARFNSYTYLGMNPVSDFGPATSSVRPDRRIGGVILFGPDGRLLASRYGFRFVTHLPGGATIPTPIGQFFAADSSATLSPPIWPAVNNGTSVLYSSIGLCLCDKQEMQTNIAPGAEGDDDARPQTVAKYFDGFTSPLLINRYSGTLMPTQ